MCAANGVLAEAAIWGCGCDGGDYKQEYIELMVEWRLSRGTSSQMNSLRQGLQEMLPMEYLEEFDSQELEWVIAGTAVINLQDWKDNTLYWGGEGEGGREGGRRGGR